MQRNTTTVELITRRCTVNLKLCDRPVALVGVSIAFVLGLVASLVAPTFSVRAYADELSEADKRIEYLECIDNLFLIPGATDNRALSHELMVTVRLFQGDWTREVQVTLARRHPGSPIEVAVLEPAREAVSVQLAQLRQSHPGLSTKDLCTRVELERRDTIPAEQSRLLSLVEELAVTKAPLLATDRVVVHGTHYVIRVWTYSGTTFLEFDGPGWKEDGELSDTEKWVRELFGAVLPESRPSASD